MNQLSIPSKLNSTVELILSNEIKKDMPIAFTKKEMKEMEEFSRGTIHYKFGKEEGKLEGVIEIAKNMFLSGLQIDIIQNFTGLPMDKLKEIEKEVKKS